MRETSARLEVTEHTVRRDVGRLRDLGYPVHFGYRSHDGTGAIRSVEPHRLLS